MFFTAFPLFMPKSKMLPLLFALLLFFKEQCERFTLFQEQIAPLLIKNDRFALRTKEHCILVYNTIFTAYWYIIPYSLHTGMSLYNTILTAYWYIHNTIITAYWYIIPNSLLTAYRYIIPYAVHTCI